MWLKIEQTLEWLDQNSDKFELAELFQFWELKRRRALSEGDFASYSQWFAISAKIFCPETGRFERNPEKIKEILLCGKND